MTMTAESHAKRRTGQRAEHPRRAEMLALLADARTRIERINGAARA